MFNLGFPEIMLILVAALLLLGPKKLPEAARFIGRGLRELRRATEDARDAIDLEMEREEMSRLQQDIDQSLQEQKEPDVVAQNWKDSPPEQTVELEDSNEPYQPTEDSDEPYLQEKEPGELHQQAEDSNEPSLQGNDSNEPSLQGHDSNEPSLQAEDSDDPYLRNERLGDLYQHPNDLYAAEFARSQEEATDSSPSPPAQEEVPPQTPSTEEDSSQESPEDDPLEIESTRSKFS